VLLDHEGLINKGYGLQNWKSRLKVIVQFEKAYIGFHEDVIRNVDRRTYVSSTSK